MIVKAAEKELIQLSDRIKELEDEMTHKVPNIVGSALNTYLGYIQSNPLVDQVHQQIDHIQNLKNKQSDNINIVAKTEKAIPLISLNKRRKREESEVMNTNSVIDMSADIRSLMPQRKDNNSHWYLQPLLRKKEKVDWGGPGIMLLQQCSLEEILFRWSFHIVEQSLHKLRPIIELLEE